MKRHFDISSRFQVILSAQVLDMMHMYMPLVVSVVSTVAFEGRYYSHGSHCSVSSLQAAFKRSSASDNATASPQCELEWDQVKTEDKTLVHQVILLCPACVSSPNTSNWPTLVYTCLVYRSC